MEPQKQEDSVKRALDLSKQILNLKESLQREQAKTYKAAPNPPVRQEAKYIEPPIEDGCKPNMLLMWLPTVICFCISGPLMNSYTFACLGMLLMMLCFSWPAIYYFAIYKRQKNAKIEEIRNSEEYQQLRTAARETADQQQNTFDEDYARAKAEYENITLPKYEKDRSAWEQEHQSIIKKYEQELVRAEKELETHYDETRIVPVHYRNIDALQYIYDQVSTSNCNVQQAIESFDRNEQMKLDEMRLQAQHNANALAMEQNELLDQQNIIAEKARRDANIAAATAAVQRHNTNKNLKNLSNKSRR